MKQQIWFCLTCGCCGAVPYTDSDNAWLVMKKLEISHQEVNARHKLPPCAGDMQVLTGVTAGQYIGVSSKNRLEEEL